ncbi:MAG: hypothetical protein J2P48_13810 [Alphaproteobacteria bacterium]|nr:hypothetical protein [Alphaproteobacteria bacterium]
MTTDVAASAIGVATTVGGSSAAWPDGLWAGSVGWLDGILRSYYGIHEFTDDPSCILRVGLSRARAQLKLSDGTEIQADELIGTLHFWNEHLPRYNANGPNLAWACALRDRAFYSLRMFSEHIASEPAWQAVQAFRTETTLSTRLGTLQIKRLFQRYGFEPVPTNPSLMARLHGLGECFVMWGLTRAFNPAALPRQPFLRDRHELWISRRVLMLRYAHRSSGIANRSRYRRGA